MALWLCEGKSYHPAKIITGEHGLGTKGGSASARSGTNGGQVGNPQHPRTPPGAANDEQGHRAHDRVLVPQMIGIRTIGLLRAAIRERKPCAKRSSYASGIAKRRYDQNLAALAPRDTTNLHFQLSNSILKLSNRVDRTRERFCKSGSSFYPQNSVWIGDVNECLNSQPRLRRKMSFERHRPRSSRKYDNEVPAAVGQNLSTAVRKTVYDYDGLTL
ncbi:hypothetical protein E3N88_39291 [Mikania micrantha]|uniref:Uncharacterized protein n=1 Tax=Mikania micrantha TaxID=192012 RepID=A0A5N6LWC3_9ASTR|nr:hypothetical protein E3N88_39291 [Mikania micrantha]